MNRHVVLTLASVAVLGLVAPGSALSQQKSLKEQLVGPWIQVSATNTAPNGTKSDLFGPNPRGIQIFESNGRYAQIGVRSDLPKFGSNNRATGTAEENKAVVQGSIAYFGTYTVDEADKSFTVQVEGSTFPNWMGTAQKRSFSISGDELTFNTAVASVGGANVVVWRRVK